MEALAHSHARFKHMILDLRQVKSIDVSGLIALESAVRDIQHIKKSVLLVVQNSAVLSLLRHSAFFKTLGSDKFSIFSEMNPALSFIKKLKI
jgi:ABC-type transporter Mla MlaB component